MTLPHLMSNPQLGRYNEAMKQAERTEMALDLGGGSRGSAPAGSGAKVVGVASTPLPAPIDFDRIDRYLEAFSRQRKISDARVWQEYTESLERRGLCLCPSCRVKVEKFGQYCETCKF